MKIYLAGCDSNSALDTAKSGMIPRAFYSFFTLRKHKTNILKEVKHEHVIIDSGAHSFFTRSESVSSATGRRLKSAVRKTGDPLLFFEQYLAWAIAHQDYFDFFVELDIGEIVGQKQVEKWRERVREAGLAKKLITVYHPAVMSLNDYQSLLRASDSKYVGLEGLRKNGKPLPYGTLIKMARDAGVRTHGFAMTKREWMEGYPFHSVDSSSWLATVEYGRGLTLGRKGLQYTKFKDQRSCSTMGEIVAPSKLHQSCRRDEWNQRLECSVRAYLRWEQKITALWSARGIEDLPTYEPARIQPENR